MDIRKFTITKEYQVNVANEVSNIQVSAQAQDTKASLTMGNTNLKVGQNTVSVTVTAEDGSKRVYNIHVTRAGAAASPTNTAGNQSHAPVLTNSAGPIFTPTPTQGMSAPGGSLLPIYPTPGTEDQTVNASSPLTLILWIID
jgi:hypothetical protein